MTCHLTLFLVFFNQLSRQLSHYSGVLEKFIMI